MRGSMMIVAFKLPHVTSFAKSVAFLMKSAVSAASSAVVAAIAQNASSLKQR